MSLPMTIQRTVSRGCTANKLKSSNWMHSPAWLLSQEYTNQDNEEGVVVQKLTVEINSTNPVPPITDLTRHSKFVKAERVLRFLKSDLNPFKTLIRQEQKLHCNSIFSYIVNPNTKVNLQVKNTIRGLNLPLFNNTVRAKGRLKHAELPVDADTLFLA